jgi:hypothetical protein
MLSKSCPKESGIDSQRKRPPSQSSSRPVFVDLTGSMIFS